MQQSTQLELLCPEKCCWNFTTAQLKESLKQGKGGKTFSSLEFNTRRDVAIKTYWTKKIRIVEAVASRSENIVLPVMLKHEWFIGNYIQECLMK